MPRSRLIIALIVGGLALALLNHACRAQPERPTTQQVPLRPVDRYDDPAGPTAELPLPAETLRDTEQLTRQFTALYLTNATHEDSAATLRTLTTDAFATELRARPKDGRTQTPANPTITGLKIRYLAATSIQYEVTTPQAGYAITLVRDHDLWKVDSLEPADAGDNGASQP